MKHANVALFVPHSGCRHMCSFCDQKSITGQHCRLTAQQVKDAAETALRTLHNAAQNAEIAFFGGSFTAIDRQYMLSLLQAAYPYVEKGQVSGIRVSTRPDAIDWEVLQLLKQYGVTSVELGAQSMDDGVLSANGRGHSAQDVEKASALIRKAGFSLGLQMMTGLYKSSEALDMYTAKKICAICPQTVRVYPTLVLRGTRLAQLYTDGLYAPPSLESTVALCTQLLSLFEGEGIRVIRLGLHSSEGLRSAYVAGPFHPALRQLCQSRQILCHVLEQIKKKQFPCGPLVLHVHPKTLSKLTGQKKSNLRELARRGYPAQVYQDEMLAEDVCRGYFDN